MCIFGYISTLYYYFKHVTSTSHLSKNHLEYTEIELAPFQSVYHQNTHPQLNDVSYGTVWNKSNPWVRMHLANAQATPHHNK